MGQPLQIVVAKFTDSDYLKRLEGANRAFGGVWVWAYLGAETQPAEIFSLQGRPHV